jgi:hypothetical protein
MSRATWVISLLLLVASAACGSPSAPSATTSHSTPSVEASARAPIPDELIGDWESRKGTDPVILTLQESGAYRVKRGLARAMGAMAAVGDRQLDFFGGDPCPERGSYEWAIEGDTLILTPVGEDECPGRAAVLDGLTYTRASDGQ